MNLRQGYSNYLGEIVVGAFILGTLILAMSTWFN
jgi:hypothetical protein